MAAAGLRALSAALLALALIAPAPGVAAGREDDPIAVEKMSAETAYRLAGEGKLILIDIRPSGFWETDGVPEHAETVDYNDPMFYDIIEILTDGDKSIPLALICNTGVRTEDAAIELTKRGYRRAIDVAEGIKGAKEGPGWLAHGLPMSKP